MDRDASAFIIVNDGSRPKGSGLNERAIDFGSSGGNIQAEDETGEVGIDQGGAVAQPPV